MDTTPPSSSPASGALILDANIAVAIVAREVTEPQVSAAIEQYFLRGYSLYAPGVLVSETLYVLCGKLQNGDLTPATHSEAVKDFAEFMKQVKSLPDGEGTLVERAEAIRGTYTCRRSADGVYIALAEALTVTQPATLLTFDEDMKKQAARYAPTVEVELLTS